VAFQEYLIDSHQAWFLTGLAALFAAALGVLVCRLGALAVRRVTRQHPLLQVVAERVHGPICFVLPLFASSMVWAGAPDDLFGIELVRHSTLVLLILAITCVVREWEPSVWASHRSIRWMSATTSMRDASRRRLAS
jgi:hypothetical protein